LGSRASDDAPLEQRQLKIGATMKSSAEWSRSFALMLMAGAFSQRLLLMSDEPRMIEFRRKYGEQRVREHLDKFDWAELRSDVSPQARYQVS
jgi:hypothetical protein